MLVDSDHIRSFLRDELLRRCRANPRYSLRAFSRSLSLDPSLLSKLLSGQRRFTPSVLEKIGSRVSGFPIFGLNGISGASSPHYHDLQLDQFEVISAWHHFAILELLTLRNAKSDHRWISRRLGISTAESRDSIERLLRLDLIKKDSKGQWISTGVGNSTLSGPATHAALRKVQSELLKKAQDALENIPPECRDQSGMTMAIDRADLEKAKKMLKEMRRIFCTELQRAKNKNQVYQLLVSFFPISSISNSKESSQ